MVGLAGFTSLSLAGSARLSCCSRPCRRLRSSACCLALSGWKFPYSCAGRVLFRRRPPRCAGLWSVAGSGGVLDRYGLGPLPEAPGWDRIGGGRVVWAAGGGLLVRRLRELSAAKHRCCVNWWRWNGRQRLRCGGGRAVKLLGNSRHPLSPVWARWFCRLSGRTRFGRRIRCGHGRRWSLHTKQRWRPWGNCITLLTVVREDLAEDRSAVPTVADLEGLAERTSAGGWTLVEFQAGRRATAGAASGPGQRTGSCTGGDRHRDEALRNVWLHIAAAIPSWSIVVEVDDLGRQSRLVGGTQLGLCRHPGARFTIRWTHAGGSTSAGGWSLSVEFHVRYEF